MLQAKPLMTRLPDRWKLPGYNPKLNSVCGLNFQKPKNVYRINQKHLF